MQKDGGEIVVNGRFSLGFPRRDKGEEINGRIRVTKWTRRRLQARVRHRRLRRRRHGVGRISPLRAVSGPVRLRHADDRQRRRLRRAVRDRVGLAAVRRQRRAHRRHPDAEERRHRRRRGVRRLERHLFVQRHRPAHSAGKRQGDDLSAGAADGPAGVQRRRHRHVRRAALSVPRAHPRPVRRRRRRRRSDGPARRARRRA